MKIIFAILIMGLVVGTACSDADQPEFEPPVAADQINAILQRIEAIETAAADPAPEPTPTATLTPPPTPLPVQTETVPPTAAPTATLSPTPIPVGRQDICYRSLPVQEALINKFSNTYLCAAIQVAELFRITELNIEAEGYPLKRTDFADMPNLKRLDVDTDLGEWAPDAFHDLSGLVHLRLNFDVFDSSLTTLPEDSFSGLPSGLMQLEFTISPRHSDWDEKQAIEFPSDLFASVPHLKHLVIYLNNNGRGAHLELDPQALSGLSQLESLNLRGPLGAIPREMFADLASLKDLQLAYSFSRDPHILYFPTLEMVLKFSEYCSRNSDICVVGGLLNSEEG